MNLELQLGYQEDWLDAALEIYNMTELKRSDRTKVHKAFENSFAVISCWCEGRLVGVGRMLSDGQMYANIYDVVVHPSFQRRGIGKRIIQELVDKAPDLCIHLTSTFGNEKFYENLGFLFHKTAMAKYPERMKDSPYLKKP